MFRIALIALLLAWSPLSLADTFPTTAAARSFTDKIMAKVAAGEIEAGVKMMKQYSAIPAAEFDAMVGQLALQIPVINQRFGKPIGSEFISEAKVGQSFVRLTYLSKYERHAMKWDFYLYKSPQGWIINTFNFDDKIQDMF